MDRSYARLLRLQPLLHPLAVLLSQPYEAAAALFVGPGLPCAACCSSAHLVGCEPAGGRQARQ